MNPNHAATIKARYVEAMSLKIDTEQFEALLSIRRRATELGYSHEQVTQLFGEVRDEKSNIQHSEPAISELKPPESTPEPPKEELQPMQRVQVQKLSERTTASYEPAPGLNPSGGKVRQSKVSILDLAYKRVQK